MLAQGEAVHIISVSISSKGMASALIRASRSFSSSSTTSKPRVLVQFLEHGLAGFCLTSASIMR